MQVGIQLGILWFKTNGVFQKQEVNDAPSQLALGAAASPGDIRFVDVNEDGKIDLDDRTDIGDPIPTATMVLIHSLITKHLIFYVYLCFFRK
jgi:hypothetical protein